MCESSFVRGGGELRLSNPGQLELLRGMVERGVPLRTTVRGFSMTPFIRDEDVLTVAPLNGRAPNIGEVVAFVQPETGRLAIHRIIARVGDGWLIRGDNSPEADGVVAREAIIGRVTRVERNGQTVRGGLGAEARLIAWLQRQDPLLPLKPGWWRFRYLRYLPHQFAAGLLRRAQGLAVYRAVGRRMAPVVTIGEASAEDMAIVQAHFNPDQPPRSEPRNPNVTNYVARHRGQIIGFVQFVYHPPEHFPWVGHWLFSLDVWGRYRGLGIGEMLTRRVMAQAVVNSASELMLVVFDDNVRAIRLYRKLGFEPIALPGLEPLLSADKQQFGRRRIVMRKYLSDNG